MRVDSGVGEGVGVGVIATDVESIATDCVELGVGSTEMALLGRGEIVVLSATAVVNTEIEPVVFLLSQILELKLPGVYTTFQAYEII